MSDQSKIEWTDATWNPVMGCTKISPGCKNCYAETFAERFRGVAGHPYELGFDLRLVPEKLKEPFHWKKPKRIFVNSMSDLFQEGVPFEYIDKVFAVMAVCPQHTFQILTKRPERMLEYFAAEFRDPAYEITAAMLSFAKPPMPKPVYIPKHLTLCLPLKNVWLGVSVENQQYADERIPLLLQTPAAVRFISYEPAIGPIAVSDYLKACGVIGPRGIPHAPNGHCKIAGCKHFEPLDWIIVGGESGAGAREFQVRWARRVVEQCMAAKVPVFVKQMGTNVVDSNDAGFDGNDGIEWPAVHMEEGRIEDLDTGYQGAPVRIRLKSRKGGDQLEWPEDLRVREYPEAINA